MKAGDRVVLTNADWRSRPGSMFESPPPVGSTGTVLGMATANPMWVLNAVVRVRFDVGGQVWSVTSERLALL